MVFWKLSKRQMYVLITQQIKLHLQREKIDFLKAVWMEV